MSRHRVERGNHESNHQVERRGQLCRPRGQRAHPDHARRAETDPKVFTHIHIHFVVSGKALDPKKVQHAIELSATKYCSASIMFGKTAKITHDFEIMGVK